LIIIQARRIITYDEKHLLFAIEGKLFRSVGFEIVVVIEFGVF
jgi:hypothetical protein